MELSPLASDAGLWSILPPLLAILLALLTKEVVFSLFVGVLAGIGIYAVQAPLAATQVPVAIVSLVRGAIGDGEHLSVLVFAFFMGPLIAVMTRAGIETADMLVAVSGNQAVNILACQLASHLGVKRSICRLYSTDVFSEEDGITPGFFGIGKHFFLLLICLIYNRFRFFVRFNLSFRRFFQNFFTGICKFFSRVIFRRLCRGKFFFCGFLECGIF